MPSGSWIHISVKPQGSVVGPRPIGTAAAASRACSAWTSRTGSRSSPSARAGRPRARRSRASPGRGSTPPRDHPAGRTPCRWPGPGIRDGSRGCSRGVSLHHFAKYPSVEQNASTSSLPSQSMSCEMFYGHPTERFSFGAGHWVAGQAWSVACGVCGRFILRSGGLGCPASDRCRWLGARSPGGCGMAVSASVTDVVRCVLAGGVVACHGEQHRAKCLRAPLLATTVSGRTIPA